MTVEQATSLIAAITGLVVALGVLSVQLRAIGKQINGRLSELLETTRLAAAKDGELAGRDFAAASAPAPGAAPAGLALPPAGSVD